MAITNKSIWKTVFIFSPGWRIKVKADLGMLSPGYLDL